MAALLILEHFYRTHPIPDSVTVLAAFLLDRGPLAHDPGQRIEGKSREGERRVGLAGGVDVSSAFLGRTKARTLRAGRGAVSSVNLGRGKVWLRVRGRRRGVPAVPLGCRFPKSGSPEIPFLDCRLRRKDTSAPSLDGALGTARLCCPWGEAGCLLGLKGYPFSWIDHPFRENPQQTSSFGFLSTQRLV